MITCEQCKRTAGYGRFGTNWVCKDCRVGVVKTKISNRFGDENVISFPLQKMIKGQWIDPIQK